MRAFDWLVVVAYIGWIVVDGLRRSKGTDKVAGYFLANRSLTVVPFFTRARVYTAYEYLERRFDVRTRSLASFLFLMGRAMALGVTLAAPAVVMSTILGWTLPATVFAICVPMIIYTTLGGVQAVAW